MKRTSLPLLGLVLALLPTPLPAGDAVPVEIEADRLEHLPESKTVTASGHIKVMQGAELSLSADQGSYVLDQERVEASGNVQLKLKEDLFTGERVRYDRRTQQGNVEQATMDLAGPGGRGTATTVEQTGPDHLVLHQATFTNCDCTPAPWSIHADHIEVDQTENQAVGRDVTMRLHDVPIFYTPYWRQPVKKVRQSGFLTPSARMSGSTGLELDIPYYFNLAPERDLTLTLHPTTRRGVMGKMQYRYLGPTYQGLLETHALYDTHTEDFRGIGLLDHRQELGPWHLATHLEGVRSRDYLKDFKQELVDDVNRHLESYLTLERLWQQGPGYTHMEAGIRWYQNLEAESDSLTVQRLPYLRLADVRPLSPLGAGWNLESQVKMDDFFQAGDRNATQRLDLDTTLSWEQPLYFGRALARGGVRETAWWNGNQAGVSDPQLNGETTREASHFLARITGEFARPLDGTGWRHTLEPAVQYVMNAATDQSHLPDFDSLAAEFATPSLFADNLLVGEDRISTGQWLAYGITSRLQGRLLEGEAPRELAALTLGRRWAPEGDREYQDDRPQSDWVAALDLAPTPWLTALTAWQYDPFAGRLETADAAIAVRARRDDLISVGYHLDRDVPVTGDELKSEDLKDVTVQAMVRISPEWRWLQTGEYGLNGVGMKEWESGLLYEHECWSLKLAGGRDLGTDTTEHSGSWVGLFITFRGLGEYGFSS